MHDAIEHLVAEYEAGAELHGRGTHEGDHKLANAGYEKLASAYRQLRERGLEAQMALLPLLSHADPAVRAWVAAHALEFAPTRGEAVLQQIMSGPPSPERLSAQMTLREWKKGTLQFP
ncbi:MAG TPA: DUF2019 domain-containing protein [Gemmatimonadaceae bacterium]|jgi:hypothetical protein